MNKRFLALEVLTILTIAPFVGIIFPWLHYFIPIAFAFIVPPDGPPFSESLMPLIGMASTLLGCIGLSIYYFTKTQKTTMLRTFAWFNIIYSSIVLIVWFIFYGARIIRYFPITDIRFYFMFLASIVPHIIWIIILILCNRILKSSAPKFSLADQAKGISVIIAHLKHKYNLIIVLTAILAAFLHDRSSPIHEAAKAGDIGKVKSMIAENPELLNKQLPHEFYESPLSIAVKKGDEEMVKVLLDSGADVNQEYYAGDTCLAIAAKWGHTGIAKLLIEKGAEVNPKSSSIETPLIEAAKSKSSDMVKLLLDHGADVHMVKKANRGSSKNIILFTPLKTATEYGNIEAIKILLDHGADINFKGENDNSAIHMAIKGHFKRAEHITGLKLLIESGANINEKGYQGKTPLHLAAEGKLLYNPDQKKNYYEPVDAAIIKFLLNTGADKNIQDDNGYTPIQYAAKKGHNDIVDLLRKHGAQE